MEKHWKVYAKINNLKEETKDEKERKIFDELQMFIVYEIQKIQEGETKHQKHAQKETRKK